MRPIQIWGWLMEPELWRFVGLASTIVGLFCYALSSTFNHLFGDWNLLKILLYSVFSFVICLAILFPKVWQQSTSLQFKAHLALLVLAITSVYSFFYDKAVHGKSDAYSPISCAAFAIMSFSLSRQTHCGFEVDLLYFFLGCLIVQLMKIKLLLAMVGVGFSYSLIILRSSLDASLQNGYLGLQENEDHIVIQVDSQQSDIDSALFMLQAEQSNTGLAFFMPQLMACIEALRQKNSNLINMPMEQVKEFLEAIDGSEPVTDHNLVIDALPSVIINDIHETVKLRVAAGFDKECSDAYNSCRKEFLEECLSILLGSQEVSDRDHDSMEFSFMIRRWIKASKVALKILFPSERRLCDRVFFGFSSVADRCFVEVCRPATLQLLNFAAAVASESPSPWRLFYLLDMFETLRDLIPQFESLFSDGYSVSLVNEAITIQNGLGEAISSIFMELGTLFLGIQKATEVVPDGGVHPITFYAMNYLCSACKSRQTLEKILQEYPKGDDRQGTTSFFAQMVWIMRLLQRILKAKSKIYKEPALRFVFVMNNRSYIEQKVKESELGTLLGNDWIRENTAKVRQNYKLYQRSSWNKVLDVLKLDNNESAAPNITADSMKEKLNLFNLHFEEICSIQSTWYVFDEQLSEEIKIFVESTLLPAYGNFIGRFQNVLGKHAYEYIKYGIFDIQSRLNHLVSQISSKSPKGGEMKNYWMVMHHKQYIFIL